MAASQNNHPLPHSDEWTQYSPEYVLEHHPAPLQDVLLVYVSMVHERGEMKAHGDKHGVKKNSLNVVTKKLSTTTERLCIIKNLNFPSWRRSYDETVSLYKRYEAGKRGSELEEKIDVHPAHEVPDETTITEDATLKDLKTINHGKASAKWIMQMAKVLEMYPDDKDGDEKLRIDWDYKDRRTAKDSKRKMLLLAAAIEASETGAPAEGDPDSIDAAVAETYRIFPSNVYSTPLLRHLAATRDERKEARQGSSASGQKSSNASKVVPKRKAADPRTGETSLDRIPKRSKLVAAPLQPGAAAAVSSSAAADFSALMQLPAAAPSSSSPDDTGGVGKQQGDAAGASTSSMGSGVTRLKRVTGRADKKQVQAPSAQPLYAPRGLFAGDRKERAAIVALERIRISLIDPDKSASLTSGAILFATFDTSLDKFEGLGEDATSAAAFHDFCHTTGIFRKHSGKAVDDFVTWVIEKFMDGPQDRGTFLNGLVADLKNMRQLTEDRAAQTKALKEQYERDSWELLDDDARVTMEDTHPLRQV